MEIRSASINDLTSLKAITARCIENLDKQGIYQWDDIYPSEDGFMEDILENNLSVLTSADKILGCICINQFEPNGYENADWIGS